MSYVSAFKTTQNLNAKNFGTDMVIEYFKSTREENNCLCDTIFVAYTNDFFQDASEIHNTHTYIYIYVKNLFASLL